MKLTRRHFGRLLGGATLATAGCETGPLHFERIRPASAKIPDGAYWMYVGTYTGPKSRGVYGFKWEAGSGKLTPAGLVAEAKNPSFLAIHPKLPLAFCVNEEASWNGKPGGYCSSYRIDYATGKWTLINEASTVGDGPCHLNVDRTGRYLLAANYGGGSTVVLPIQADGRLGEATSFIQHKGSSINPNRQKEPHAHSVNLSPDNRFAVVADLGLDQVLVYRFDAERGVLSANAPAFTSVKPGSGPRHFDFHPSGKYAYVINELVCTTTAFEYDAKKGELREIQTISTLPPTQSMRPEYSTAEIRVHPTGRFVFGSNRGHDSITVFAVGANGRLIQVQTVGTQGKTPRNFNIDPSGRYLFAQNQSSDSIVVFKIDPVSGKLTATGETFEVGGPCCIRFAKIPA